MRWGEPSLFLFHWNDCDKRKHFCDVVCVVLNIIHTGITMIALERTGVMANKAMSDNVEETEAHFCILIMEIWTVYLPLNFQCRMLWLEHDPSYTVEEPYSPLRYSRAMWVPAPSTAKTSTCISGVVRWLAMQTELSWGMQDLSWDSWWAW